MGNTGKGVPEMEHGGASTECVLDKHLLSRHRSFIYGHCHILK